MSCCKHFFGAFGDPHVSPPPSDDDISDGEEEDLADKKLYKPKDFRKVQRLAHPAHVKGQARQSKLVRFQQWIGSDGLAARSWARYVTTEPIENDMGTIDVKALKVHDIKLPQSMLKSLRNQVGMYAIELVNCNLKEFPFCLAELDKLKSLTLSRNKDLTSMSRWVTKADNKTCKLIRLVLAQNSLKYIDSDTLSGEVVEDMVFLDIGENALEMLPNDFMQGAKNLQFLRVRENHLTALPNPIFQCSKLLMFDCTSNQITALPENVEPITGLRKLYLSSNLLTSLPEWIGNCLKLEKIRMSNNKIRELPKNFLNLESFQDNPDSKGVLEELQVDGNPLIIPSITSFEMGGLPQMFRLFREHIRAERERKAREEQMKQEDALMAAPQEGTHNTTYHRESETGNTNDLLKRNRDLPAITDSSNSLRTAGTTELQPVVSPGDDEGQLQLATLDSARSVPDSSPPESSRAAKDPSWWFFDELGDDEINEIRGLESAILLVKKAMHVEGLKQQAGMMQQVQLKGGPQVDTKMKAFLDPAYKVDQYKKRIPPCELDLNFALVVYACKPLFANCTQLFNRFASSNGKVPECIYRKDFENWCSRVPVKLSDDIKHQMWKMLIYLNSSSSNDEEHVTSQEFIAVLHVHDIESRDPYIERVAKVLRLQFYQSNTRTLSSRLAARTAETDAFPHVESDSSDQESEGEKGALPKSLPVLEGERMLASAMVLEKGDNAGTVGKKKAKPIISKTEAQYLLHSSYDEEDSDQESDDQGGQDFSSEDLSGDDSSESEFEHASDSMRDCQRRNERQMTQQKKMPQLTNGNVGQSVADGDLAALMEIDPRQMFDQSRQAEEEAEEAREKADEEEKKIKKSRRKKGIAGKQPPRETNFSTNVYTVRQALREAYRNMPFHDFVALINFVLRGLKTIKHYDVSQHITYFHHDDPVLKYITAEPENKYPQRVLEEMGFFLFADRWWIWPYRHLGPDQARINKIVPRSLHCAGCDESRIDDMIKLAKWTQSCLTVQGKKFRGHVKQSVAKQHMK